MQRVIPCKYYFVIIRILSFMVIPSMTVAMSGRLNLWGQSRYFIAATGSILMTVFMLIPNGSLLYYYIKGLHVFSGYYFRYKEARRNILDDRVHELMLESTRYFVLFGSCIIFDIIIGSIGCMTWILHTMEGGALNGKTELSLTIITECVVAIDMILLLSAIYLSFKFNHDKYEIVCYYCDVRVKDKCHSIVKRRHRKYKHQREKFHLQQTIIVRDELNSPLLNEIVKQ